VRKKYIVYGTVHQLVPLQVFHIWFMRLASYVAKHSAGASNWEKDSTLAWVQKGQSSGRWLSGTIPCCDWWVLWRDCKEPSALASLCLGCVLLPEICVVFAAMNCVGDGSS